MAEVLAALAASEPRCGGLRVVALDGPAGAGKSTLAAALAGKTGAPVVHMDDIYPGWDGLAAAPGLLAHGVLAPLSRGVAGSYRRWDWAASAWAELVPVPAPSGGVLIVEGCGASVGPSRPYASVTVWLEAPVALLRARGLARDGEAFAPHWAAWVAQEAAVFAADRTRECADLVVRTG